jgi:4-amino-4-deoxy-L-arabinose transferase-like glycosyltransferase
VAEPTPFSPAPARFREAAPYAAAFALAGLCLAAWTGLWRETAVAASLPVALAAFGGHKRPRLAGLGHGLALGLALYTLVTLALAGLDSLHQVRLPLLASPFVANPIEGREALKGWLLTQGTNIYPSGQGYPRLITLYPPLYYVLAAGFAKFADPGLWCGRLAALAGLSLLMAALFGLGRRQAGPIAGVLAALAFFILPDAEHGFLCKPDALAVGLLLCAAWALPAGRSQAVGRGRLAGAALLLAGASLSKQQMWPLVGVAFLWSLFVLPRRRDKVFFAVALAAAGVLCWGAALGVFGRGLFEQVALFPQRMTGLATDNSLAAALSRLRDFGRGHGWLLAAYAAWLAACLVRRRLPLPEALFLGYLPFLGRTLMWSGSDTNHFLLAAAIAALGAANVAGMWLFSGRALPGLAGSLALAALLPSGLTLVAPRLADLRPKPAQTAMAAAIRHKLEASAGPVLMDAEGAYLFAGTADWPRLRLYDAYETDVLDRLGMAPILDSVMAADIRARRSGWFVDSEVFVSRRLLDLLGIYYEPAETLGRYTFYRPRADAGIVAVPVADRVARRDSVLSVQVSDAQNIKQWGRYIQAENPAAPLVLVYEAVADTPVIKARLGFAPRLTAPGQTATVVVVDGEGRELARASQAYGDVPESGEGVASRLETSLPAETTRFRVRFELSPGAQLWLSDAHPLVLAVEADRPGALPTTDSPKSEQ